MGVGAETGWIAATLGSAPPGLKMLATGDSFDGLTILRSLGKGAMGHVWEAQQSVPKRRVALKVLLDELAANADLTRRFEREINAMAAVEHDNVVPIYGAGHTPAGNPYFTMRYVTGRTLEEMLSSGETVEGMLEVLLGAARGLDACHRGHVVHRDVKPSNILAEDSTRRGLLADFGVARARDFSAFTHPGHAVGTPRYMAPEVLRGEGAVEASDIFSLGCVVYRVLTGHHARPGQATPDARPLPPSYHRSDIGPALDGIVLQALSAVPEDRPTLASSFVEAVRAELRPRRAERTMPLPRRRTAEPPDVESSADSDPTLPLPRGNGGRMIALAVAICLATPLLLLLFRSLAN
jgi:serine/threonine-protein kinase